MSGITSASVILGKISYSCKYPSCKSAYYSRIISGDYKNKKFHRFPKNPEASEAWKQACNISPSKNCNYSFVCQDHFSSSDYSCTFNPGRLRSGAIPRPVSNLQPRNLFREANFPTSIAEASLSEGNSITPQPSTSHDSSEENQVNVTPTEINNEHEVIPSTVVTDYTYHKQGVGVSGLSKCNTNYFDKYSFLLETRKGILGKTGLVKNDLTSQGEKMYQEYRNVSSKLVKLRNLLGKERAHVKALKNLYNEGRFQFIEESLNEVSKEFFNSQLRNIGKSPQGRRWTVQDKAFALSIFKRSPRLYRYLRAYFQLPSVRTLQIVLSSIPFECGIIKPVLDYLGDRIKNMSELDRCCTLMFDEISLSHGFYYDSANQKIYGFEDLGSLGRNSNSANHALVFMIRGRKSNFKMPVAFYFVQDTIKSDILPKLIVDVIEQLDTVGLSVVATVCDQGPTNRGAITTLLKTHADKERPSPYHFVVNSH